MPALALQQEVRPTWWLILAISLLTIGLVMVASTSASIDTSLFSGKMLSTTFGRQLLFALIGVIVMLLTAGVAPRILDSPLWRIRAAWVLFALVVISLAAVFVPGLTEIHRGSQRWVKLGVAGLSFQPSELAKPATIACLAALFARERIDVRSFWKSFAPAALLLGFVVLLVGKENLGTAALLCAIGFIMFFVSGCRFAHLGLMISLGVLGLVILLFDEPYRLERLKGFQTVWEDPQGKGYQPMQSLITIATGGWLGSGLGAGVQKFGYLPESRTDFIFSALCEETGMLGAVAVMGLFAAVLWLGVRTMFAAPTRFERLLAFGLSAFLVLQAIMNIAVVTVLVPTTGVSLPLISAGGSGTVAYCFSMGLLAAIAARSQSAAGGESSLDERAQLLAD